MVFAHEDAFVLPVPATGTSIFSFYRDSWDVEPDRQPLAIDSDDLADGATALARRGRALVGRIVGGRAFCDAYAPERVPIVAADTELPQVVYAGGGSGSGSRLAPGIAKAALDALEPL